MSGPRNFGSLPLSAIFAIDKPSGPTCMSLINLLKPLLNRSRLFVPSEQLKAANKAGNQEKKKRRNRKSLYDFKIGQGGTLDPLASGVLVVGVGKATKMLGGFMDCDKVYEATVLLGSATDSYDSEGAIVRHAPFSHVTRKAVEDVLPRFSGNITQVPPIYSALKMDGKPLYEYARKGLKLPQPIQPRPVKIHLMELVSHFPSFPSELNEGEERSHTYSPPSKEFTTEQIEHLRTTLQSTAESANPMPTTESIKDAQYVTHVPPALKIRIGCSGGTYIRTLAHDIGIALGSAGHIVQLRRLKQGAWDLGRAIPWKVFEEALKNDEGREKEGRDDTTREWFEWEQAVMEQLEVVGNEPMAANVKGAEATESELSSKVVVEEGEQLEQDAEDSGKRKRDENDPVDQLLEKKVKLETSNNAESGLKIAT